MTEQSSSINDAPSKEPPRTGPRRRFRNVMFALAAILALGGAGLIAAQAFGGGHGWHGGGNMGMHGGMGFMGRFATPALIEEGADRMVRHLAIEIDANNEQQDKLRSIVRAAVKELLPLRETMQSAREQARTLLTQPTINRADIEKHRAAQVATIDQASRRMAQAITEAAEVLNPEQRRKLSEMMEARRGGWRPWHRG